jgi:VWFA-related protein
MRTLAAASCAYGIAIVLAVAAQEPSPPKPTFRAGVDVVQVDVSVLDKDRKPVRGLTAGDFTVLEDGKPRPVAAFLPVELPQPERAPAGAQWLREVGPDVSTNAVGAEGRLVVIMFDWSIRLTDQALARRIASAAVDQLGPDDLAAVVFTSGFGNAGAPQNFTADRARLLAAINRPFAVAMQNPPKGTPFHDPRNDNDVMIDDPEGYEAGDCYCRMCVPDTIGRIADTVREVRGRRKVLLFIGTYVRLYESLQGPTTRLGPEFKPGRAGLPVVHPGVCSAYLKTAREKMERATSLANLTIHAVDPVGMETAWNSPMGGSLIGQMDRRDDLTALADTTGGRTVLNTNAPEALIPAIIDESGSYYLVAFAPADPGGKGKFHKIEVKVNRPGVSVRTRGGYYSGEARAREDAATPMSSGAGKALDGVLPRSDVPLGVAAAPFALPGKEESALAVVLSVEPRGDSGAAAGKTPVKVLAAAFDRSGHSVHSEEQTVAIAPRIAAGGVPYEVLSRLTLKPGRYEVRVALEDGDRRGSVYTFVDVPEFTRQPLSLSGIAVAASPARAAAPPDAFAGLLPIVPTAQRQFGKSDTVTAFVRVYQRLKDAGGLVDVTARIIDATDRSVFQAAVSVPAERFSSYLASDYRLQLPIERLATGEYLLTIDARQGERTARTGLRFTIK